MADEERQRERKRRRRKSREGGEQDIGDNGIAGETASKAIGTPHESSSGSAEAQFEWETEEGAPPGPEPRDITPPSPGPAAVAQILAAPSLTRDSKSVPGDTEPATDPFFAQRQSRPADTRVEADAPEPHERFVEREDHDPVGQAYAHERPRWTHEPVLMALLLVAIIVLALNTYLTWRLNGLSDRLAAAAKPAPTATASAERPWVGVDSLRTTQFANGGQPVTTVHIVNSGREPAYDLRSNTVGSLRSSSTPAPQIPTQKGPLATTGLLLPNTGGNLTFFANTRALTSQEAGNVRSGQFVLWLAGRLDYKDSKGHVHLTTFRYRYNPQLNSFIAAPDGNSAN